MHPRVLLRTHYQADEPRLIISLAVACSSPIESRQEDSLAACLVRWARSHDHKFSLPAANYAIGNARALDLINDSHRLTATGLAFAFLDHSIAPPGEDVFALTSPEQHLYLRQYLIASGALVIGFGRWLLERGRVTDANLRDQNTTETIMRQVMDEYLSLATEVRDRTAIRRERDRLKTTDYGAATKRHKRYPLVTSLRRLELVEVSDNEIRPDTVGRLAAIVRTIPNVATLEKLIRDQALDRTLSALPGRPTAAAVSSMPKLVAAAYEFAMAKGIQACSLAYLSDSIHAVFPNNNSDVMSVLDPIHSRLPSDLRYHVDRRGRRAFVIATDKALVELRRSSS